MLHTVPGCSLAGRSARLRLFRLDAFRLRLLRVSRLRGFAFGCPHHAFAVPHVCYFSFPSQSVPYTTLPGLFTVPCPRLDLQTHTVGHFHSFVYGRTRTHSFRLHFGCVSPRVYTPGSPRCRTFTTHILRLFGLRTSTRVYVYTPVYTHYASGLQFVSLHRVWVCISPRSLPGWTPGSPPHFARVYTHSTPGLRLPAFGCPVCSTPRFLHPVLRYAFTFRSTTAHRRTFSVYAKTRLWTFHAFLRLDAHVWFTHALTWIRSRLVSYTILLRSAGRFTHVPVTTTLVCHTTFTFPVVVVPISLRFTGSLRGYAFYRLRFGWFQPLHRATGHRTPHAPHYLRITVGRLPVAGCYITTRVVRSTVAFTPHPTSLAVPMPHVGVRTLPPQLGYRLVATVTWFDYRFPYTLPAAHTVPFRLRTFAHLRFTHRFTHVAPGLGTLHSCTSHVLAPGLVAFDSTRSILFCSRSVWFTLHVFLRLRPSRLHFGISPDLRSG